MAIYKGAVAEGVFVALGEIESVKRQINAENAQLASEINRLTRTMNDNFRHIETLDMVMNVAVGELQGVIFGDD